MANYQSTTTTAKAGEGVTQIAKRVYGAWDPKWKWIAYAMGWPYDDGQLQRWTGPTIAPGAVVTVPLTDPFAADAIPTVTNTTPSPSPNQPVWTPDNSNTKGAKGGNMMLYIGIGIVVLVVAFMLLGGKKKR